jgi:hypothetical protein
MNVNPLKMLGGIISHGRNRAGGKRHE